VGLLEETKKIYNWEPSDGDYFLKESDTKRKISLKKRFKKYIPITTIVVLILVLLTVFVSYYIK
jgi:hypothetical protein